MNEDEDEEERGGGEMNEAREMNAERGRGMAE